MKYLLVFILLLIVNGSYSQVAGDSIVIKETQELIKTHPYFNFDGEPERLLIQERSSENHEGIFYFVIALVFYIALMRLIFYKYMSTMFTLFFRATLRQQQLREQMLQARLPALLMNIFFIVVFSTYAALVAKHFGADNGFWHLWMVAMIIIGIIYTGKFLVLNIVGWIFGISNASDTYIFIVFMINKMIAIFLLPFVILLAFPTDYLTGSVLAVSYVLVAALFIYRYIISYRPIRSEIKLSRFQFFLYLCAFEIAPLLLIYKVLLTFEVSRL